MDKHAKKRLSRDDWLHAALETLRLKGVDAVKVQPLARMLGVTRGSFYWHFKDRDELLDSMLDFWAWENIDSVLVYGGQLHLTGKELMISLIEYIISENKDRYEQAVRAWALFDDKAAAVLKVQDKKRLGVIVDLFKQMGYSDKEAAVRGRMVIVYLVSDESFAVREVRKKRLEVFIDNINIIVP